MGGEGKLLTNSRFYIHSIRPKLFRQYQFGRRLSLDGEKLIVGYGDSSKEVGILFSKFAGWKLNLPYPNCSRRRTDWWLSFWTVLWVDGNRLTGCKTGILDSMTYAGAAYLFDFNGSSFSQVARFSASDGAGYDKFGSSVDVSI